MFRKLLYILSILCFSLISQISYAQDTDLDGTANNIDQDEDNDGVPDELDGCSTINLANTIGIGSTIITNSSYTLEETNITYTTNNASAFYGYVAGNQGDAIRFQGPGLSNAQLELSFSTPIQNVTFKITDYDDNEEVTVNAYDENDNLINLSATNVPFLGSFVDRTGNLISAISTGTNSEGDDDAGDITGAAYLYFPNEVSRIVFIANIANFSSMRITELNYCLKDTDNDGVLDFLDIDSDNDGIPDIVESGGVDTDGDGYVDNITDNNSNGIPDIYDFRCTNGLTGNGYATSVNNSTNTTSPADALNVGDQNYSSINSGGTLELGFTDVIPAGNNIVLRHIRQSGTGQIPFNIERSIDGINYFNSQTFTTSFNGFYEVLSYDLIGGDTQYIKITNLSTETLGIDYAKYNFGAFSDCSGIDGQQILNLDTDTDGLTNAQDLDSDGDGIFDIIEANTLDSDGDGLADGFIDSDGDGYNDNYDGDVGNDGTPENSINALILTGADTSADGIPDSYLNVNTDSSGFPNPYDIDADDDGIPDNVEAQLTNAYIIPAAGINANGINNAYPNSLTLIDTDGDGIFDYLDSDTDNDGTQDIQENGDSDILSNSDSDLDGLDDNFDNNNVTFDVNDEVSVGDIADLTLSFGDADGDTTLGGDLDYRDVFDINPPSSASIDFDGVDDYVEVPNSAINGLTEYTVSLWFRYTGPTLDTDDDVFVFGQKDVFEISIGNWVTPFNPTYNSIRGKVFYNDTQSGVQTGWRFTKNDWTHIAVVVKQNGTDVETKLFRNGYASSDVASLPGILSNNANPLRMGIVNGTNNFEYNFTGWMDEVRIFKSALTDDQVRQMVFQEIEENLGAVKGKIVNKDITDTTTNNNILWTNLVTYYPMTDILVSKLIDKSSYANDATLFNITTILPQTAPMPFETQADGDWSAESTWLNGNVWDIENLPSFDLTDQSHEPWSIVQIHNNITTASSHSSLGLFIDTDKTLSVSGDNSISNSWYLQLDGTLDLADDSQLVQGINSDLVTGANGKILRRQEGNLNYYRYNYWSSPVGAPGITNNTNTDFSLNMLKDGLGNPIVFTPNAEQHGEVSSLWLYKYQNGRSYDDWVKLTTSSTIEPGVGYSQKGTNPGTGEKQYIFEGKPNNGTITLLADDIDDDAIPANESLDGYYTSTLIGNPYPSAIDARIFINDNLAGTPAIKGTILLWEQWAGDSHYLTEYQGGYGYINLSTTERAYQYPGIGIAGEQGVKRPTFFIPVGQGFFVEVIADNDLIEFNNGQRVFVKESDVLPDQENGSYETNGSSFFRSTNTNSSNKTEATEELNPLQLIRMEFKTSQGASRRFVLGFGEQATDGLDYGLDGGMIIDKPEDDMGSLLDGQQYVIQAMTPITADKVVDLTLNASGNYAYSLKVVELRHIADNQDIYLRDNFTNTYFDLKREQAYNFTSDAGEFADRFDIVFQSAGSLSDDDFNTNSTLIYVNNTEDKLYIKGLTNRVKQLSLTNILGQSIKTYHNISKQTLETGISISNLSSGVYVVSVTNHTNQKITKKIIID